MGDLAIDAQGRLIAAGAVDVELGSRLSLIAYDPITGSNSNGFAPATGGSSKNVTSTVTITAVNDAPTLSDLGGAANHAENTAATRLYAAGVVIDPHSTNFSTGRLRVQTIDGLPTDRLAFRTGNDAPSLVINQSPLSYTRNNRALKLVAPSTDNRPRTLSFQIKDPAGALSPLVTRVVNVIN